MNSLDKTFSVRFWDWKITVLKIIFKHILFINFFYSVSTTDSLKFKLFPLETRTFICCRKFSLSFWQCGQTCYSENFLRTYFQSFVTYLLDTSHKIQHCLLSM